VPRHSHQQNLKDLDDPGSRNPTPEAVLDEQFVTGGSFFDARDIVQVKYEMLRRVANGQSIDEAIRAFGFPSRQSFYRARIAFEQKGLVGLMATKRGARSGRMRKREPVLRITESAPPLASTFLSDDLEIDFVMRRVRVRKKEVRLTPKEFGILRYLVTQVGKPIPHRELLCAVWGPDSGNQIEHLRVFITYLRKKIEPDPTNPKYILTEPWVGYRFKASNDL
jgi:DNA-binding winged helix-turn-helix (wHTH) protein